MKLNPEEILKRANKHYGILKCEKHYPGVNPAEKNLSHWEIQSDQVKALCHALCEAINNGKEVR